MSTVLLTTILSMAASPVGSYIKYSDDVIVAESTTSRMSFPLW